MSSSSITGDNGAAIQKRKKFMSDKAFSWLLISPLVFMLIAFMLYPTLYSVITSFTEYIGGSPVPQHYVGGDNYRAMLTESYMWASMVRTIKVLVICVVTELVLGMCIALILNRDFKGMNVIRGLCFMPLLISPLAMSLMWYYLLSPDFGLFDVLLGRLGVSTIQWFSKDMALYTIMGMIVWQWLPFSTFVLLAGLKGLPKDQFEAAQVDGASPFFTFRKLTLPTLKPLIMIITLLRVMWLIRTYDPLYGTTKGGMNTELFDLFVYRQVYVYSDFGRGTAIGVISLVLTLLLSFVLYRYLMKAMNANS